MDKETKAKVDEFIKSQSMRELSLDELDNISGGTGECFDAQKIRTEEDLYYYVYVFIGSIEKYYGRDVALDIVLSQFPSYDVKTDYMNAGLDGLHNLLGQKFIDGQGVH